MPLATWPQTRPRAGPPLRSRSQPRCFWHPTLSNGEAIWTQALPIVNGEAKGVGGGFVSDAGGTVPAEVAATCLK